MILDPKVGVIEQLGQKNRQDLIGLAALDWPLAKIHQARSWLQTGEISEADLRLMPLAMIEKLSISDYQVKTAKKFFSEYNFASFLEWLADQEIRVSCEAEKDYPQLLRELDSHPAVLWHRGHWPVRPELVAVVGTRHPSLPGIVMTQNLVTEIVSLGLGVVSGFMFGSDQVAQQQALKVGGWSVGVLGFGLNKIYPASFFTLTRIFLDQGGTLVSPFPPWTVPQKWRFLERNKIVAGLAKAVIVTEALPRSGTHTTVTAAADLGRLAGVLPSAKASLFYPGAKVLLDEGVSLVENVAEFLKADK